MKTKMFKQSLILLTCMIAPVMAQFAPAETEDIRPGRRLVRHCLGEIRHLARATNQTMEAHAKRGIRGIQYLQAAGNTEQAQTLGTMITSNLNGLATQGSERIAALVTECTVALSAIGASEEALMAVSRAGEEAKMRIANKLSRTLEAVQIALMD